MVPVDKTSRSLTTDITVCEQQFRNLEFRVDVPACGQPVVPDSHEPCRQGMQQEPA